MRKPWIGHLVPLLALSALGCHGREAATYPTWAPPPAPYAPAAGSSNAFDAYALAAAQVEAVGGTYLDRVSFYPGQKAAAAKLCDASVRQVSQASKLPCDFRFVPRTPFAAAPYQRGWRLIGRVICWRIEDAAAAGKYDEAIDATALATRFGFDLTGGGATDASLGFAIVDDARKAIAPWLPKLGAEQLRRLGDATRAALQRKPPLSKTIEHEGQNMRMAVQALQDAYQKDDLKTFSTNLGPDVKEAVQYLSDLHKGSDAKRADYFQGLAEEGDAALKLALEDAGRPASERPEEPKPTRKERPWKRFGHQFFATLKPLVKLDDRTVARTRMLALNAYLFQAEKAAHAFPKSLAGLPTDLTVDPYTGHPFFYRADPAQFLLYSVGDNLRDDGGSTDESFTTPDLTLERKD